MRSIPTVPLMLGLAGLIPFWVLAIVLAARLGLGVELGLVDQALSTYAAIIISFLGGIRWGLAVERDDRRALQYVAAVLPSLVAWGLLAAPEPWRLTGLSAVALVMGPIDARMVGAGLAPPWLGRLRIILSSAAGAALLVGAIGSARV